MVHMSHWCEVILRQNGTEAPAMQGFYSSRKHAFPHGFSSLYLILLRQKQTLMEAANSAGADTMEWLPREQTQARDLWRTNCKSRTFKGAGLSQWSLPEQAAASDIHRNRYEGGMGKGQVQANDLCMTRSNQEFPWEQAWARSICRDRPEATTSAREDQNQWLPQE